MGNIQIDTIEVTVDKSHIVTIGERLYGESIELIRELINNVYDADAIEVKVTIKDDEIIVEDDGLGMDLEGLKQYFSIGSVLKRNFPKSPKFKRDRIGEFGIGKFATLSACSCFQVWTKRADFQAKVTFDKEEWGNSKDKWHIPLEIQQPDYRLKDGTKIVLKGLTKKFDITDVEKRIIETVPIKGEVNADFLPITNDRTGFIKDTPPIHKIPRSNGIKRLTKNMN